MSFMVVLVVSIAFAFAAGWTISYHRTMRIMKQCVWSNPLAVPYISVARETVIKL